MLNFKSNAKLQFVSRETFRHACKQKQLPSNVFIISINDTTTEADEIHSIVNEYVPQALLKTFVFPDEEIGIHRSVADEIIKFAELANKQELPIVVHCLAGISRSGAV